MKKFCTLAMIVLMTFATGFKAMAIENPFPKGTFIGSAHLGYFPGIGMNIAGDYVLVDEWWKGHFTVGGYVGFNTTKDIEYANGDYRYLHFAAMPRASYGLNISKDFEVHAGVMMGVCFKHHDLHNSNAYHFEQSEFVGCRYQVANNFYLDAELNYSFYMSYFNIGCSLKL